MFAVLRNFAAGAFAMLFVLPAGTFAQDPVFANRPIQIVVGFPAGGIFDTVNRILIGFMERDLKVQMIPVPIPGAGAAIAMQKVARGSTDGHTLMLVPSTALLSRPIIMGLPISYRDFVPIASVAVNFTMIAVKKDHPWRSVEDLVRDAAKRPDKHAYAIPGIGGNPHFAMELVSRAAKIKVVAIPYQGSPQAILAALSGEADFVVTDNSHPQIRPLATLSAKRSPFYPEVPTMKELGYPVELFSRFSLVAPRGTPQRPTQVLEASASRAVADADVRKGIERQGLEAVFESGQALARALREQSGIYERLISDLGLAQNAKRGN
jgi:tripartite-type tricarboxylate transporter receptor subunit TctC